MSGSMPDSFQSAKTEELKKIRGVCLDIDDTLSTHGKLEAEAYAALWRLKEAGFAVVPITGRPAGWCDMIARFWPVDAVVGENGAFTFYLEGGVHGGVRKRINTPAGEDSAVLKEKLTYLSREIQETFPNVRWASDQSYREFDLAIDICEDVPRWASSDVDALLALCHGAGAHAKLSSIHVNTWFGEYDKRKGFDYWLSLRGAGVGQGSADEWLYIGDSPNDEPMFATFKYSVGVANLKKYLNKLKSVPTWITQHECGAGFVEMADRLIAARG